MTIKNKDRVKDYCRAVLRKTKPIITGSHVKNACKRHLRDLKEQEERNIYFDLDAANKAIRYFENVLRLSGGEHEGVPFILLEWQAFVIGSIYGWKVAKWKNRKPIEIGFRRFTTAYCETGKGSGKSPLAAGIGLHGLTSDKEPRAEIYSIATKKDQAMILFRDAVSMYQQSPELSKRLRSTGAAGREWNLYYQDKGSFFRPIGSENTGRGQSGFRPFINLYDEVHEHPTNAMIEFMSAGKKNRRQPLDFMITNSGHDKNSVCYEYHDYGSKVCDLDSGFEDDSFFAYICSLDDGDDPFKDEKCWIKANPSLPLIPGYDYLRKQVSQAKGMPSKESIVRRLNFCEWVDSAEPWISKDLWLKCIDEIELPEPGLKCVAGLDLSSKKDLTALTLVFETPDKIRQAFTYFFTPKDTIREREKTDRVPYSQWVRDGYLIAVPGKSIDYAFIAEQIKQLHVKFDIQLLAFDRWKIDDLITELDKIDVEQYRVKIVTNDKGKKSLESEDKYGSGIAMLDFGQGYKDMSPAVDDIEQFIIDENILIQKNPVMNNCAANAVLQNDPADNRKFTKQKSTGRIDGMISLSMANRVIEYISLIKSNNIDDFLNDPIII